MKKVIGIDIGGTMVKFALLSVKGDIIEKGEFLTEGKKGIDNLYKNICGVIKNFLKEELEIIGIAVSGTGQIDGSIGKVIGGNPIIPGWIGTNLVEKLERDFNLPSVLENDVNCAALGEKWIGAGKGKNDFICLTIGTGIGGGIVVNGELLRGSSCVAAEFGHIQIVKDGIECLCGKKGCYERYASATALVNFVEEAYGKRLNGKEIFELSKNGNEIINKVLDQWVDYFTDGLSTFTYIFNPSLIIVGGGVTKQGDYLLDKINRSLENKIGINFKNCLEIKFAELGNDAGLIGATYLLLKKINLLDK